jgi:4-hydroxy-tetrahydrodipicolinate synthase
MVLEHLARIGGAVSIPFYVFYTPGELGATKLDSDLIVKLIGRIGNFAGLVDASLEWQFMILTMTAAWQTRADFQLVSGTEYMVSAGAIGATSMFSSLDGVAPLLVRRLYDICRTEKYFDAQKTQKDLAALRQIAKRAGIGGLKGALRAMGRACGQPRPPLDALTEDGYVKLAAEIGAMAALRDEPHGW